MFFAAWLAFSPIGNVVLGKDDDEAEFGLGSWFAMLFAAGMGIGLVFWVAEPLNHFNSPPPGTGESAPARADAAFDVTFLHWGLHAWAIYVVVGLAVAYAVHRKGRPISIRWALEPLLGATGSRAGSATRSTSSPSSARCSASPPHWASGSSRWEPG